MQQSVIRSKIKTDIPLRVTIIVERRNHYNEISAEKLRLMLESYDEVQLIEEQDFYRSGMPDNTDLAVCTNLCGYRTGELGSIIGNLGIPVFALDSHCCFHTYHAAFNRQVKRAGGILLPAFTPDEIKNSLTAVRKCKALRAMKLIQVSNSPSKEFTDLLGKQTGIEVVFKSSDNLKQLAANFDDTVADRELERWYSEIISGSEMPIEHMRQIAKLYLAERAFLEEFDAVGITVSDISDFLLQPVKDIMPNASYGILVNDGYLACEEGDIEVLTSELIIQVATGRQTTMSNLYYYYRDSFSLNGKDHNDYTDEMKQADAEQCFADNCVTLTHFGAYGVIPPDLAVPEQPRIRNCPIPGWIEQSMIFAVPDCPQVVLGRISPDASEMHVVYGKTESIVNDDRFGWIRGRWIIKLPNAKQFAEDCFHQHYAVGKDSGYRQILKVMLDLMRIKVV
jgi:hypothetical protein